MTFGPEARTIRMSSTEFAGLPRYTGQRGPGYFRDRSTADRSPMVMTYVDQGVTREIWYHCEVEDLQLEIPRAFNSCICGREFPGPRGATEFVKHFCS